MLLIEEMGRGRKYLKFTVFNTDSQIGHFPLCLVTIIQGRLIHWNDNINTNT